MLKKDQRGAHGRRSLPHDARVVDVELNMIFISEIEEDRRLWPLRAVEAHKVADIPSGGGRAGTVSQSSRTHNLRMRVEPGIMICSEKLAAATSHAGPAERAVLGTQQTCRGAGPSTHRSSQALDRTAADRSGWDSSSATPAARTMPPYNFALPGPALVQESVARGLRPATGPRPSSGAVSRHHSSMSPPRGPGRQ